MLCSYKDNSFIIKYIQLEVLLDKYEPKQEWAMVREYRERALARRLDRDGAKLEQYTKKQKVIPIGGAVAVQNQTGRFPNKWDKTGVVMENMDHDKVLVRMDGSRRLTTRIRRSCLLQTCLT